MADLTSTFSVSNYIYITLIVFVFLDSKLVYYKCNFCENIHNSYFS